MKLFQNEKSKGRKYRYQFWKNKKKENKGQNKLEKKKKETGPTLLINVININGLNKLAQLFFYFHDECIKQKVKSKRMEKHTRKSLKYSWCSYTNVRQNWAWEEALLEIKQVNT